MVRLQQLVRAIEMREGAASIDIGDEQRGCASGFGYAHVHDIGRGQVDLGGGARAFDDHHVVRGEQAVQTGANRRPQMLRTGAPLHPGQIVATAAEDDHLTVRVSLGLQQHRVHPHVRSATSGQRLKILGAAHLPRRDDAGIVAHVLRLERRDAQSLAGIPPRERGGQETLPGPARGSAHHDGTSGHGPPKKREPNSAGTDTTGGNDDSSIASAAASHAARVAMRRPRPKSSAAADRPSACSV